MVFFVDRMDIRNLPYTVHLSTMLVDKGRDSKRGATQNVLADTKILIVASLNLSCRST